MTSNDINEDPVRALQQLLLCATVSFVEQQIRGIMWRRARGVRQRSYLIHNCDDADLFQNMFALNDLDILEDLLVLHEFRTFRTFS
jgi:hypothetical protein